MVAPLQEARLVLVFLRYLFQPPILTRNGGRSVIITKDRVVDASLKRQVETNTLHICERHFREEKLYFYPTCKALKEGVHPTLNLPVKSITSPSVSRSTVAVEKRELHNNVDNGLSSPPVVYPDFTNFKQRIFKLKLPESWGIVITDSLVTISCLSPEYILPIRNFYRKLFEIYC